MIATLQDTVANSQVTPLESSIYQKMSVSKDDEFCAKLVMLTLNCTAIISLASFSSATSFMCAPKPYAMPQHVQACRVMVLI